MRIASFAMCLLIGACAASCGGNAPDGGPEEVIAAEKAALDRWSKGDPQGYLKTFAPDVTYFDPTQERRVDGAEAMKALLAPIAGKFSIDRYEMVNPKVQQVGDAAVVTFNLVNYRRQPDGSEAAVNRWNSTEVYQRVNGAWKLAHSHWSYTQPQLAGASAGQP